jgi:hypothetical protein
MSFFLVFLATQVMPLLQPSLYTVAWRAFVADKWDGGSQKLCRPAKLALALSTSEAIRPITLSNISTYDISFVSFILK